MRQSLDAELGARRGCLERRCLMSDDAAADRLTLDIERTGDVAVVRCSGQLVAGVTEFLYTEISRLLPDTKRMVLDLTDLAHMDSTGLGTLVRVYVSCKS